jgi:hypothetical protein
LQLQAKPCSLLDCNELLEAFKTLQAHSDSKDEGTIPFNAFPEHVQDKLKDLDLNGDKKIDANEIVAGMQALQREKKKSRQFMVLIFLLCICVCVLLGGISGLLVAFLDMSKESKIGSNGVMVVKGTNEPVRIASTDFTVIDGILYNRASDLNRSCSAGACPLYPIQVSEV